MILDYTLGDFAIVTEPYVERYGIIREYSGRMYFPIIKIDKLRINHLGDLGIIRNASFAESGKKYPKEIEMLLVGDEKIPFYVAKFKSEECVTIGENSREHVERIFTSVAVWPADYIDSLPQKKNKALSDYEKLAALTEMDVQGLYTNENLFTDEEEARQFAQFLQKVR